VSLPVELEQDYDLESRIIKRKESDLYDVGVCLPNENELVETKIDH